MVHIPIKGLSGLSGKLIGSRKMAEQVFVWAGHFRDLLNFHITLCEYCFLPHSAQLGELIQTCVMVMGYRGKWKVLGRCQKGV